MNKQIVVLVAQVKYPSSNNAYLSTNSFVIEKGNMQDIEKVTDEFKSNIETDDFKIINMLAYVVPQEQVAEAAK